MRLKLALYLLCCNLAHAEENPAIACNHLRAREGTRR